MKNRISFIFIILVFAFITIIGNAYVDAGYAVSDTVRAAQAVKEAEQQLSEIKKLKEQGKATDKAVQHAQVNLAAAVTNMGMAAIKAAESAANAAGAASTSFGTGFYADLTLEAETTETKSERQTRTNLASQIKAGKNITLLSGKDIISPLHNFLFCSFSALCSNFNPQNTVSIPAVKIFASLENKQIFLLVRELITHKGSITIAMEGDINYKAENNIEITASKDTDDYKSDTETKKASVTIGSTNPVAPATDSIGGDIGYSEENQQTNSETYNNSQVIAEKGSISVTTGANANIAGANLLAENIIFNIGKNLFVESKQNLYESYGNTNSFNLGYNTADGGAIGGGYGKNNANRLWTDIQTSIIYSARKSQDNENGIFVVCSSSDLF